MTLCTVKESDVDLAVNKSHLTYLSFSTGSRMQIQREKLKVKSRHLIPVIFFSFSRN